MQNNTGLYATGYKDRIAVDKAVFYSTKWQLPIYVHAVQLNG